MSEGRTIPARLKTIVDADVDAVAHWRNVLDGKQTGQLFASAHARRLALQALAELAHRGRPGARALLEQHLGPLDDVPVTERSFAERIVGEDDEQSPAVQQHHHHEGERA